MKKSIYELHGDHYRHENPPRIFILGGFILDIIQGPKSCSFIFNWQHFPINSAIHSRNIHVFDGVESFGKTFTKVQTKDPKYITLVPIVEII